MAGLFGKIAKWAMIGGGSVLSALGLVAIGAPLIVAGSAINTQKSGTIDPVSAYAANLELALNTANSMKAAGTSYMTSAGLMAWIQKNFVLVIVFIAAIVMIVFKPFKRRR
jgi:hypothetical protein